MKKRRVLGLSLIIIGLILFFLKPISSITGLAVAENISPSLSIWLYALGLGMMIAGVVIFISESLEKIIALKSIGKRLKGQEKYRDLHINELYKIKEEAGKIYRRYRNAVAEGLIKRPSIRDPLHYLSLLENENPKKEEKYTQIARKIYEKLAKKASHGHHTEHIEELQRTLAKKGTTPTDIHGVIKNELRLGRLSLTGDLNKGSLSLPDKTAPLDEIISIYGPTMDKYVLEKLRELRERHIISGARNGNAA